MFHLLAHIWQLLYLQSDMCKCNTALTVTKREYSLIFKPSLLILINVFKNTYEMQLNYCHWTVVIAPVEVKLAVGPRSGHLVTCSLDHVLEIRSMSGYIRWRLLQEYRFGNRKWIHKIWIKMEIIKTSTPPKKKYRWQIFTCNLWMIGTSRFISQ